MDSRIGSTELGDHNAFLGVGVSVVDAVHGKFKGLLLYSTKARDPAVGSTLKSLFDNLLWNCTVALGSLPFLFTIEL